MSDKAAREIVTVLRAYAAQENHDGEPYDSIQAAAELIECQQREIASKDAEIDRLRGDLEVGQINYHGCYEALKIERGNVAALTKQIESYDRYIQASRQNTIVACPECPKMIELQARQRGVSE